jgi:hypothetical protein
MTAQPNRHVTQTQMERLAGWSMRKPVIALMGEFSAGKSTLMNLLLGQNILPTQVTATRMPPVWIKYGDEPAYRVDHAGRRHPVDMLTPGSIPVDDTRFVRLHCTAEILKQCDLMDTPGISDPNIKPDDLLRTVRYASSVMWCSHAGQAWRESERGAWEGLPERLRQTSILLVTRKDKIETEIDQRKIDRRLERETSHLFNARIFVSLTDAIRSREAGDEARWAESGAPKFLEMLEKIIEGIYLQRSFQLARYETGEPRAQVAAVDVEVAEVAAPEQETTPDLDVEPPAEEMPVLRSSGSSIGISAYRLKSPDAATSAPARRVGLAEYRLKHPLEGVSEEGAAPEDRAAQEELDRSVELWDAIARQFDVRKTPKLSAAVEAVLADLRSGTDVPRVGDE